MEHFLECCRVRRRSPRYKSLEEMNSPHVRAAALFPDKMPLYDMATRVVSGAFDSSFVSVLEDKTSMGVAR